MQSMDPIESDNEATAAEAPDTTEANTEAAPDADAMTAETPDAASVPPPQPMTELERLLVARKALLEPGNPYEVAIGQAKALVSQLFDVLVEATVCCRGLRSLDNRLELVGKGSPGVADNPVYFLEQRSQQLWGNDHNAYVIELLQSEHRTRRTDSKSPGYDCADGTLYNSPAVHERAKALLESYDLQLTLDGRQPVTDK